MRGRFLNDIGVYQLCAAKPKIFVYVLCTVEAGLIATSFSAKQHAVNCLTSLNIFDISSLLAVSSRDAGFLPNNWTMQYEDNEKSVFASLFIGLRW